MGMGGVNDWGGVEVDSVGGRLSCKACLLVYCGMEAMGIWSGFWASLESGLDVGSEG